MRIWATAFVGLILLAGWIGAPSPRALLSALDPLVDRLVIASTERTARGGEARPRPIAVAATVAGFLDTPETPAERVDVPRAAAVPTTEESGPRSSWEVFSRVETPPHVEPALAVDRDHAEVECSRTPAVRTVVVLHEGGLGTSQRFRIITTSTALTKRETQASES